MAHPLPYWMPVRSRFAHITFRIGVAFLFSLGALGHAHAQQESDDEEEIIENGPGQPESYSPPSISPPYIPPFGNEPPVQEFSNQLGETRGDVYSEEPSQPDAPRSQHANSAPSLCASNPDEASSAEGKVDTLQRRQGGEIPIFFHLSDLLSPEESDRVKQLLRSSLSTVNQILRDSTLKFSFMTDPSPAESPIFHSVNGANFDDLLLRFQAKGQFAHVINVFVAPDLNFGLGVTCGKSTFPFSGATQGIVMSAQCLMDGVKPLPHLLGHFFGLEDSPAGSSDVMSLQASSMRSQFTKEQETEMDRGLARRLMKPSSPSIQVRASPNPFSAGSTVTIQFNATESNAYFSARVYNLKGAPVRVIEEHQYVDQEGMVSLQWDGRNEEGQSVPPGVYFIKINFGEGRGIPGSAKVIKN